MLQARLACRLHSRGKVGGLLSDPSRFGRVTHHHAVFRRSYASDEAVDPNVLKPGGLHVVGTPIGNLQDLTPRALAVLKGADRILCEDTRRTLRLCNYFEIRTPLESLHEHNEASKCDKVKMVCETRRGK